MAQLHYYAADWGAYAGGLAWTFKSKVLVGQIGRDLSPPSIIAAMLAGKEGWCGVVSLCEAVLFQLTTIKKTCGHTQPKSHRGPHKKSKEGGLCAGNSTHSMISIEVCLKPTRNSRIYCKGLPVQRDIESKYVWDSLVTGKIFRCTVRY